jgi:hypothetical protein
MGGGGMLSVAFILPIMGKWFDNFKQAAVTSGVSAADANNLASSQTFMKVAIMPAIVLVIFILIYLARRKFYAQHKSQAQAQAA